MENHPPSLVVNALKYGLIMGVAIVLYSLLLYSLGMMSNKIMGYLTFLVIIALLVWIIKDYRDKKLGGFITFGNAFLVGFLSILFASIISSLYTFLFFKYFDPDMVNQLLIQAEEKMLEMQPNMEEADLERAMSYSKKFMRPEWMAIMGLVWNVILGAIIALIIAAIMKKEENSIKEPI